MPPSPSGIADYSAALVEALGKLVDIEIFADESRRFDPGKFDLALYQIGNNPYHSFVYEAALRHPGVVVMHEANLHHLIADITIKRGNWDEYLKEAEFNGGGPALEHARRARALQTAPNYDGLAMNRRLLESAKAIVVHSRFMMDEMRMAGFGGPAARIPHGASIANADRHGYRERLGLDESTPLVGIFGHLKPYKRVAESLRAFRRLARLDPRVKMILVGEPHPELPLDYLIRTLGLDAHVRKLGFAPIEDFVGYMAACDIVLNLRNPTAGESSGSLMRALGLGKATLVSSVGAFRELPSDVCLQVAVDAGEEDLIFEYLNLLVSRPEVARELGARARQWVENECTWDRVAARYADFLDAVKNDREWIQEEDEEILEPSAPSPPPAPPRPHVRVSEPAPIAYIASWATEPASREYVETHQTRLAKTLAITPPGAAEDRILEMGAYLQITPGLHTRLGYGTVRGCYYGTLGQTDPRRATSADGETFECDIDLFDAEKDVYPYADGYFATVLCCELIEHLREDPMHLMAEVNRILRPGGHLVITTPNITSLGAVSAILQGYHPGFFHSYVRPRANGETEARHNREYTPGEIKQLLEVAGFAMTLLETGPFREEPRPEYAWVRHLMERYQFDSTLRGEGIYAVGRKTGTVHERYPDWLYS